MPPNLRKSYQPNLRKDAGFDLSKPSEGGSFDAGRKPSQSTNPLQGLNISAEREIGSAGGIKATGKLAVGVDNLIGQQGLTVEADASNRTLGVGLGIGSTRGKLGVNIGGKVGYDEEGKVSIKGAEAGINIGGFGGSASIDEDEGIRGSISVAGAKVEIGIGKDGKKSVSLCYGVPGGEFCVTFEPDPQIHAPTPTPTLTPQPQFQVPTNLDPNCYYDFFILGLQQDLKFEECVGYTSSQSGQGWGFKRELIPTGSSNAKWGEPVWNAEYGHYDPVATLKRPQQGAVEIRSIGYGRSVVKGDLTPVGTGGNTTVYNGVVIGGSITIFEAGTRLGSSSVWRNMRGDRVMQQLPDILANFPWGPASWGPRYWNFDVQFMAKCPGDTRPQLVNFDPPTLLPIIQLPNYPQHYKPMECCDLIKEIYQYLGIAKLKKNKFPVSNAFLVPGGSGNDNCLDYYSILQALFRMLANGLIINPKSKPLGSEWQNANATAWASSMYEMMAEAMSDGNSSQRFEIAAMMQLVQIMSCVAENGRKIEFVADGVGLEPSLESELLPVCFTIHESHTGFGKKELKKINVSGAKTDKEVEEKLGAMLRPSFVPITKWKFKPGQISISEALGRG